MPLDRAQTLAECIEGHAVGTWDTFSVLSPDEMRANAALLWRQDELLRRLGDELRRRDELLRRQRREISCHRQLLRCAGAVAGALLLLRLARC